MDDLLRQAGRPDLVQLDVRPVVAVLSAATVGAVLASRQPRHPVGWLLLAQVVSLLATGAAAQYLARGLPRPWRWRPRSSRPAAAAGGASAQSV